MRYLSAYTTTALLILALLFSVSDTRAQISFDRTPRFTVEVNGGGAKFSRFLGQRVDGGDRLLVSEASGAVGGAISLYPAAGLSARASFSYVPTQLAFEDDTGTNTEALDVDDIADMSLYAIGLDVSQFFGRHMSRVTPFASLGLLGAFWNLDAEEALGRIDVNDGDESEFRLGATAGAGLQFNNLLGNLGMRLEGKLYGVGSPFAGGDSFRAVDGDTFDKPRFTRGASVTLGLTFSAF